MLRTAENNNESKSNDSGDTVMALGVHRLDAYTNAGYEYGMHWGIAMKNGSNPYLVRFEYSSDDSSSLRETSE